MTGVTSDPNDPRLGRGVDTEPIPQHDVYLVDGTFSDQTVGS
jgi:hypothetical protein